MKIGITGGAGFIGGHVAEVALARGHEVLFMDRSAGLTELTKSLLDQGAVLFMGDVRDATAVTEMAAHVDGIIHLAACLGTQETIDNPFPAAETNVLGGLNFLQACRQYKIPGVYIGVGNHWMNNSYSITKTAVERFVHMYNAEHGTRVNIVRLVNAYGPRQSVAPPFGPAKVRKITPAFICRALAGQAIEIYGDGSQISDMIHVTDGALALVRALEKAAAGVVFPYPVEVGPRQSVTVLDVAKAVLREVNDLGLGFHPDGTVPEPVFLPMRPGETVGTPVVANTATLDLVGMSAADLVPLADGIRETVAWYVENWLPVYRADQEALELANTQAQQDVSLTHFPLPTTEEATATVPDELAYREEATEPVIQTEWPVQDPRMSGESADLHYAKAGMTQQATQEYLEDQDMGVRPADLAYGAPREEVFPDLRAN